jgi:hypothetical protein
MIPSLSTYGGLLHDPGYAGMLVDQNSNEIINLMNEGATAIQFGGVVCRGSKDDLAQTGNVYPLGTCKAPAADADKPMGLAVRYAIMPAPGYGMANANVVAFAQNSEVPILRRGRIYAVAAENVTVGDAVLSLTAGNGTTGGTTGGGAGAGRVAVPGATWETTTTSGNLGIIRINS